MTLVIDAEPELMIRLEEEAAKKGLAVKEYVRRLLESQVLTTETSDRTGKPDNEQQNGREPDTEADQWERAFETWIKRHGVHGPPLREEALQRDHIYGDEG